MVVPSRLQNCLSRRIVITCGYEGLAFNIDGGVDESIFHLAAEMPMEVSSAMKDRNKPRAVLCETGVEDVKRYSVV